jgi:hypothetical protein
VVLGVAGLLAVAHGAALLWVKWIWREFGIAAVVMPLLVTLSILAFFISPRTDVLFGSHGEGPGAPRRRRWWMLSLQWTVALLIFALAAALLVIFDLGPMVEVVWIAAELSVDRP